MSRSSAPAAGRVVHDLGLAALLGGTLFGRLALHPAVAAIEDPRTRGRVVNDAWRRYGAVNGAGLAAVAAGWLATRDESRDGALGRVRDGLVGAVALTGLATAAEGVRFARQAPAGAVPLADGDTPAPEASPRQARTKGALRALGAATLAAEAGLVAVNAALAG